MGIFDKIKDTMAEHDEAVDAASSEIVELGSEADEAQLVGDEVVDKNEVLLNRVGLGADIDGQAAITDAGDVMHEHVTDLAPQLGQPEQPEQKH